MASDLRRPPYDAELATALQDINAAAPFPNVLTDEMVRATYSDPSIFPGVSLDDLLALHPISCSEHHVPALNPRDPDVTLSIFTPKKKPEGLRPCVYFIHSGGMIMLNRFFGIGTPLSWIPDTDAVVVTVEYRLGLDNPFPAGVNDCYAGLAWISEHVQELGIDSKRLMIAGQSGGSGLAAGVALMCKDRKGPELCAQYLECPMLDDRSNTLSALQFEEGTWSRGTNMMAWNAVLKGKAGQDGVSIYAAAARAKVEDLVGLPSTFISVGSAEVFRDESVTYASKLWAAGVSAELHVFGGGFHGYELLCPQSRQGYLTNSVQAQWVKSMLAPKRDQKEDQNINEEELQENISTVLSAANVIQVL